MQLASFVVVLSLLGMPATAQQVPPQPPAAVEATKALSGLVACRAVNNHALGLANLANALTRSSAAHDAARRMHALDDLYHRTTKVFLETASAEGLRPDALLAGAREVYGQTLGNLIGGFGQTMISHPENIVAHIEAVNSQQKSCKDMLMEVNSQ